MTSMRSILFPPLSASDDDMPASANEQKLAENFAILKSNHKKRRVSTDQQQELALETAVLAQQEMQRWQNSIQELEALLHNNNNDDSDDVDEDEDLDAVAPIIPAVVVVVVEQDDDAVSLDDTTPATAEEQQQQQVEEDDEYSTATNN